MSFTLHNADKKQIITDAEEDNPPIGKLPSIIPDNPIFNQYFSPSILSFS